MKLTKNQKQEIRRQYQFINNKELRKRENPSNGYSKRDDFQRDYTRVLYSPSFRRLQGKMQINGIKSDAFYRNRLTHSLEVAQIATSIGTLLSEKCSDEKMYKDDIFVLQAAALAHDIGHPAFGHKGERVLDEIAKNYGLRFEGNAQNFRILRTLERKEPKIDGVNLTYRTLLAINKYIVSEDEKNEDGKNVKKFMYKDDFKALNNVRGEKLAKRRTLDVQIIELADDIAYAVHDLEDGLHLRKFNIDEILHILKNKNENKNKDNDKDYNFYDQFNRIVTNAKIYANGAPDFNVQKYSKLFRNRLTSVLTNLFVNDITIREVGKDFAKEHGVKSDNYELSLDEYNDLLYELKKAVFECSTRDTNIQEYERKGEIIIKSLFKFYTDLSKNNNAMLLPPDYRPEELQKKEKDQNPVILMKEIVQNSIDYIAGMMDTFAISEYERIFSIDFDNIDLNQDIEIKNRKDLIEMISKLKQKDFSEDQLTQKSTAEFMERELGK